MVSIPDEKLPTALSNMESNIADRSAVWEVRSGRCDYLESQGKASSPGIQYVTFKAQCVSFFKEAPQMFGAPSTRTAAGRLLFREGRAHGPAVPGHGDPRCVLRLPHGSHYSQN